MNNKRAYFLAGVAVLLWGTVSTSSKLLTNQYSATYALTFAFLSATVFFFFYNLFKGKLKLLKQLSLKAIATIVGVGSLGVLFYNLFLLFGTNLLPAQKAFVINDLWPALIIIFSCMILREKMTFGKIAAIAFSFLGIIVVVSNGDLSNLSGGSYLGALYCVIAAICYGLYCTLNKLFAYDKDLSMLLGYGTGTIVALICTIATGDFQIPSAMGLLKMSYNGLFCNAIPYLCWALALDMGDTAIIANLAYLTPFISLVVTHVILGEEITIFSFLGLILIVFGIIIQILFQKREALSPALQQKTSAL
ncbi:MAG: DMT family transporter [Lachnospiraceae bacterium]|nr:DMT family transporter [Lachnospiraceae bacterium]